MKNDEVKKYLILVILLFSQKAAAETISCPWKIANAIVDAGLPAVMVIAGHEKALYRAIEQDIGGDYDEAALQAEWNELNVSDSGKPVVVHCFRHKQDRKSFDLEIPEIFKRCISRKNEFFCTSNSIACLGYVDDAEIVALLKDDEKKEIQPTSFADEKNKEWLDLSAGEGSAITATCLQDKARGISAEMPIPSHMKVCRLKDKRFICAIDRAHLDE